MPNHDRIIFDAPPMWEPSITTNITSSPLFTIRMAPILVCAGPDCSARIEWARGSLTVCAACGQSHCLECMAGVLAEEHYCNGCREFFEECVWCGGDADLRRTSRQPLLLCRTCESNSYTCTACRDTIELDDYNSCEYCGEGYCTTCCEEHEDVCAARTRPHLHYHDYMPELTFYGSGPQFMGVELEIDNGENGIPLTNLVETWPNVVYLKEDGSLSERGIEIVTHPATLDYHLKEFPWLDIIEAARTGGYKATVKCGLHVHVSRAGLGDTFDKQDRTLSNLIILFYKHWEKMVEFSRRRNVNLNTWAKGNHLYKSSRGVEFTDRDMLDCKGPPDRYVAINCRPPNTIEFRLFASTLEYNTLMATLEMVDHVVELSKTLTSRQVYKLPWEEIVSSAQPYTYLPEYLEVQCVS